jgi:hypothetical protein
MLENFPYDCIEYPAMKYRSLLRVTKCFLLIQHLLKKGNVHVQLESIYHVQHFLLFLVSFLGTLLVVSLLQGVFFEVASSLVEVREFGDFGVEVNLRQQTVSVI